VEETCSETQKDVLSVFQTVSQVEMYWYTTAEDLAI